MKSAAKSRLIAKVAAALERVGLGADASSAGPPSRLIMVALSGGPDSVALLHALRELAPRLGYRLAAAHLNHRLRGAESDRDEAFVRELCAALGIELIVERARGLNRAARNLEERARHARYAFMAGAAARLGAAFVATAHHADDQAETVMLRLLRGAGAAGLGAMAETAVRAPGGLTIVRPMLGVWRREILRYLESIRAHGVSDSSNADRSFLRNRVRLELMPALEHDYAPGLRRRLGALAAEMRELGDYVARAARDELRLRTGGDTAAAALDLRGFADLHPALAAALLREFVALRVGTLRGLTRRHVESLRRLCLNQWPSATADLPGGWRAGRRYGFLGIEQSPGHRGQCARQAAGGYSVALARSGITRVAQAGFVFSSSVVPADSVLLPSAVDRACFDADLAAPGLLVRGFLPGDRISPLGMAGSRKLQDVFVDRKLPRARRGSFPVVTLEGRVAWVPGMARGRIALVTAQTLNVLCVVAREENSGRIGRSDDTL